MRRLVITVLLLAVFLFAACTQQPEPELTTTTTTTASERSTTTSGPTTTPPEDEAEEAEAGGGEEAPQPVIVEEYEVVVRSSVDQGEVLWVLIPPADYGEVALEGLVAQLVDEVDATLYEVHVFDDATALQAGRIAPGERTEEEQALVEAHHLVSLVEGNVVRFQGPYADSGEFVLGS